MSIKAMSWAQEQTTGSPATKLVLFKLADNSNDTGVCWPSLETIAKHTELSRSAVKTHIKKLVELNLLRVEHRKQETTNLSNIYHLSMGRAGRNLPIGQDVTEGSLPQDRGVGQDVTPNSKKQQSDNILPLPQNGNGALKKSSEEGQFAKKVYDHWNSKIYPESNGGEKYDDSKGGRDMKHLVEVVKAVKNQDPREWDKRLRRFAGDEDAFLIKQGHAIHLFKWNAYSEMSMQKRQSPSTGGDVESPAYMRGQHA